MIHILTIAVVTFSTCLPTTIWESIGPYRGNIEAMAVAPSNEDILYCATYNPSPAQIFKSVDGGESWNAMCSLTTYCLAVDPADPAVVYGGAVNTAHKSTDGGVTWTTYTVQDCYFYSMCVHPTSPDIIFASGQVWEDQAGEFAMGFLKSTDGGISWTQFPLNDNFGYGYGLALDPSDPDCIYVGGCYISSGLNPGVYKSTDAGSTFVEVSSGLPAGSIIYTLSIHPTSTNILYAGTNANGIYRSTDSGGYWTQMCTYTDIHSLSTSAAEPDVVYAGGFAAVYKTTDAGLSWSETGTGIHGKWIKNMVVKQTQATAVYAANNAGVYRTSNGGNNWFHSSNGINLARIPDFDIAPASPSVIYAIGLEGSWSAADVSLYKTTNHGVEWSVFSVPLSCGDICAVAVNSTDPSTVLALEGMG